jgi:hypothetical protein
MEDWSVAVRGHEFVIQHGTITDGASIPRFLWRVCGCPHEAPRVYAALLHDWLYANGAALALGISRAEADECYYAMLRHFGIGAFRAGVEFYALRLCGGSHYNTKGNEA